MKKIISLILTATLALTALFCALPVNAAEGYKEGDVIYLDYSQLPEWHTPSGTIGSVTSLLYINFNNNTRYVNGEKQKVVIGEDLSRFNPKKVTEEVEKYVYKYVVTADDAGASTLMFWRGNTTNLWNNSVELTYENFRKGKNLVSVSDWDNTGSISTAKYNAYSLEAEITYSPENPKLGDEITVNLNYKTAINADVTYKYEISNNGVKIADSSSCTFKIDSISNRISGMITAYLPDGSIAVQATDSKHIYLGDFKVVNFENDVIYAHAFADNGIDAESWVKWTKSGNYYYFYLPSSVNRNEIEIYSTYSGDITFDGVKISPFIPTTVPYSSTKTSTIVVNGKSYTVTFMNSGSEAALFVNNDFSKADNLWEYLCADKENASSASASVVDKDGTYESTTIKKIKGRGNTTWNNSDKKPFNINFDSNVTVGTMQSTKKYSLLANFQDPSMSRNRILYDLADAVNLRYSSDSRFVDFYVDGVYKGQYQICQKIDPGKKNLINGIEDDDHLTDDKQLKEDFEFLIEVPFAEDFYTSTASGIDVVIKSPDVEGNDNLFADEVKAYVRDKFDTFYKALKNNSSNLSDLADVDSLAICYLVQELGKNWDTHSWYLVYEKDVDGKYRFFGSPVWDFDNSIGNAGGVKSDLDKMKVTDYSLPTGWWCKYKTGSNNLSYLCTQNTAIMNRAKSIWFERFVPAIDIFKSTNISEGEIFSSDVYYNYLAESADMNYRLWTMTVNNGWVCDHSKLNKADFDYSTLTYKKDSTATSYAQNTFKGQYDYMADWFTSRAAWISNEWKANYVPVTKVLLGDADNNGIVNIVDATSIQKTLIGIKVDSFNSKAANADENKEISVLDATLIQKYIVGLANDTNIGKTVNVIG